MTNPRTQFAVKKVLVKYNPLERHWYRVADYVQGIWHRAMPSRTGRVITVIFAAFFRLVWFVLKLTWWLMIAACVVGFAVMYSGLMFAFGQGKLAKALGS